MEENNPFIGDHFQPDGDRQTLGFDLATAQMWADFIVQAAASGLIGNAVYQFLRQWERRRGRDAIEAFRQELHRAVIRVKRKPSVSNEDLRRRMDEIIDRHLQA